MKRSNRLILLIGVLLAIVAFVAVILLLGGSGNRSGDGTTAAPTELPTVFAAVDIPLGTKITAEMVTVRQQPITGRDATAFADTTLVLGKIARQSVVKDAQLTAADFAVSGQQTFIDVPPGLRAIAVQVDQISGVGTLIHNGDYVDMIVGLSGDQFPVITINPDDQSITVVAGLNNTSVKLLLEGMQVIGTLLPPAPAAANGATAGDQGTSLNGQQEIVILAATPQQAEVIKYAQQGSNITLVLRSTADFVDPDTGEPVFPPPAGTTGIILRSLIDEYGVLVPELVEAILPTPSQTPAP